MTSIVIIRHAEAEGNYYRRAHGHYDSLLTPNGEAQREALRNRFATQGFNAVYSSDMYRAKLTASILRRIDGDPVRALPVLRELHLGDWEDVPWGELAMCETEALSIFMHHPGRFIGRGASGESTGNMSNRMFDTVRALARVHRGQNIAVVSHGLAIRALMAALKGLPLDRLQEIPHSDNTAVSLVKWDGLGSPSILFHGDNSHLGTLSTLGMQHWWRKNSRMTDTNLWFRPVVSPHDLSLALNYQRDAWLTVYGTLDGFLDDVSRAQSERMLAAHPKAVVFAMREQTPVGLVQLDTEILMPDNTGHISLLYLIPETRGQSLGAQLIGHAVSVYRGIGRVGLHLRVARSNRPARRLYAKAGFHEIGREDGQHGELIVMKMGIALDDERIVNVEC